MAETESSPEIAPAHDGLLTVTARTLGHAVGKASNALGLEKADASVHAPRRSNTKPAKTAKRLSARTRRKEQAVELKAQATEVLQKHSANLGAPYRRVMGKPAANWTAKDIDYMRGLITKQSA